MADEPNVSDLDSTPTLQADRWLDVKAIFELALTLDAAEWSSFLELKCGKDQALLGEVRSLLSAHQSGSSFLEEPLVSVKDAVDLQAAPEKLSTCFLGSRIGTYILEREIGVGGMGAVFLANRADAEFEKRVAIKLIRSEKVNDFVVRRFRQERQILARLEHPFIARLIDGGTTDTGMPYFVMEYVEGRTLTQYCDEQNLTARDRLELFLKVCSAVQYAHERQIIHRDLKPGNILVKANGTPKLLDFGIAKMLQSEESAANKEVTALGMRMLTPAYASPEQMRGDPATACSDIYSLGVVLYELLCGERPSLQTGQSRATGAEEKDGHIARALRTIIYHAIRLAPEDRYSNVAALAEDLRRYLNGLPTQAGTPEEIRLAAVEKISIAILPFRETGSDAGVAFLNTALTDALITRLSKVDRLSVRPTSAVLRYAHDQDTSRAARELRVKYLLEGSAHATPDSLHLNVQLVSAETGLTAWASSFSEAAGDLLKLEDSLSEEIALALIPQLTSEERQQLSQSGTVSAEAHRAYLRGRFHWSRSAGEPDELSKALLYFSQAIAADPQYARAHAGIADYYLRLGLWGGLPPAESFAAGITAAEKALQLDPMLAEAHASLGFCLWAFARDYVAAEREFQLAIARNPDYASAHHWFGLLNSARNRPELALANLERAHKVDPNSPVIAAALGFVHYNARRYQEALHQLQEAARDLRYSAVLHEMLAWCYLQLRQMEKAEFHGQRSVEAGDRSPASLAVLARVKGERGDRLAAQALCAELAGLRRVRYISGYDLASALVGAGDIGSAMDWLEHAYDDHDWWLCWTAVDPRWDVVQSEPRFQQILSRIAPVKHTEQPAENTTEVSRRSVLGRYTLIAIALVLAAALGLLFWLNRRPVASPFVSPRFARLTGDGTAQQAAISPEGGTVVYTTSSRGTTRLWKKEEGPSGSAVLLLEMPGDITGLDFTGRGREIAFQSHPALEPSRRQLFTVSLAGGKPTPVLGEMTGPASLSFDGTQAAIVRANRTAGRDEIIISDLLHGGRQKTVAECRYPDHFSGVASPAWSRDNQAIAWAVELRDQKGFFMGLHVLDLGSGKLQKLLSPRWLSIQHLSWVQGQAGLAVVGREQNSAFQQIWHVPFPRGKATRLGSDVDSYLGASLTTDGSELVSVRRQTLANIYYLSPSAPHRHVQVTQGTGRYFDLAWTPAGGLLYASDSTGTADIWSMDSDGGNPRLLTPGNGLNWAPAASPDGRYIAYHANPTGSWQIWRADSDGNHRQVLTSGPQDSNWPQFTADSQSIVFHRADKSGLWTVWKVPVAGGPAAQITTEMTAHPAVSPKNGKLAVWYASNPERPHWVLAVLGAQGGHPEKTYELNMPIAPDSQLAWNSAGDGITFLSQRKGVWNLWIQPLNGRPPQELTFFTAGQIYSFNWSRDERLAFSQGTTTTDVVLVRGSDSHP